MQTTKRYLANVVQREHPVIGMVTMWDAPKIDGVTISSSDISPDMSQCEILVTATEEEHAEIEAYPGIILL